MTRKNVIIDCDPGLDDAIMLFMALGSPEELNVLGVTTVAGNVNVDKTQRNARMICELAGASDAAVFAGASRPLVRDPIFAEHVHGAEGLDGIAIFEPDLRLQDRHAVQFIIDALNDAGPGEITLIATGPLTNLALAQLQAPEAMSKVNEIVIMGGALREGGNVTPSAEFNIFADPHAAEIIFKSGIRLIVLGLDVTHQLSTSPALLQRLSEAGNTPGRISADLLKVYQEIDVEKYGADGAPLHDPCTVAYVLQPELFKTKHCNIRIETSSVITAGHTAVDFWNELGLEANAHWVYDARPEAFFDLLVQRISNLKS